MGYPNKLKQKAKTFLKEFKERFKRISEAIKVIENEDPTNAYEIISLIKNAKAELEENSDITMPFESLRNCDRFLDFKFDNLVKNINHGLDNIFVEWDQTKFQSYLKCYYMLQHHYPSEYFLLEKIPTVVKKNIKYARSKALEAFLPLDRSPTLVIVY